MFRGRSKSECIVLVVHLTLTFVVAMFTVIGIGKYATMKQEVRAEAMETNRVYADLDITPDESLTESNGGNYYVCKIHGDTSAVVNFIEKVDTTDNYEIISVYKYSGYTYIAFKYVGDESAESE